LHQGQEDYYQQESDIKFKKNLMLYCIIIIIASLTTLMVFLVSVQQQQSNPAFAAAIQNNDDNNQQQHQPNVSAANLYETRTMTLGKNIKNLVILIPNEGHEDPIAAAKKELRIINQPYLPENAVVNVGTTVTWFNGDVGHRHSITLVDNNAKNTIYNSGRFDNFNASKPITFNNTGIFPYSGPSYDRAVPNYKMNGTVTVVNQPLATTFNTTTTTSATAASSSTAVSSSPNNNNTNNIDTIATLMVPSKLLDKVTSELKDQGFRIDNQYAFKSLRGGGSATGGDKQQVLLVLTSSGKNLNEVVSTLSKISPTMPYS
jgi:plastocyanin